MDFIDALPKIRQVAYGFCKHYKMYQPDELINEAWIQSWKNDKNKATTLYEVGMIARRDIIDYIRAQTKSRNKNRVLFHTNVTSKKSHKNSINKEPADFFSQIASSKDLKVNEGPDKIDNLDTIKNILESISERDRGFLTDYYLHDLSKDEMAEKYNVKKTTVEVYNARSLKECRKSAEEREMILG